MFGGPNGSYLKHLTMISVAGFHNSAKNIIFKYEENGGPISRIEAIPGQIIGEHGSQVDFPINGPAGEVITGLWTSPDPIDQAKEDTQPGYIKTLKVCPTHIYSQPPSASMNDQKSKRYSHLFCR
jgi:hypothetical protein